MKTLLLNFNIKFSYPTNQLELNMKANTQYWKLKKMYILINFMLLHYVLVGTHIHYAMKTIIISELLFYPKTDKIRSSEQFY